MALGRLPRSFFERDSVQVARELLGCTLVRVVKGRRRSGTIVEAEAYRGPMDPASHAFRGRSKRNEVMFGEGGHAYVYFVYGFHNCVNVTTERVGVPGAVLVRALEPKEGLGSMMKDRGVGLPEEVASGPGKLTRALAIDRRLNGEDLVTSGRLFLEFGPPPERIGRSARVGVSRGTELPWRFFAQGSRFVSKGRVVAVPKNP